MLIDPDVGYYRCNGVDFASKVDALLYAQLYKKPVEWIFHQDVFEKYPWHIEPEANLDSLYDQRAREIREQYDYIIINFSGGADSYNMLSAFTRQNLHVDEILVNHLETVTERKNVLNNNVKDAWNLNAEYRLQAVPRLQELSDKLTRTKITSIDVSDLILDTVAGYKDPKWVLHRHDHLSPAMPVRYNYFYYSDIKKRFDKNLKIAMVHGTDKPVTKMHDGDLYLYFNDTATNITSDKYNNEYSNVKTELFYWSPSTMPMVAKQAHTIKKWLETNPHQQQYWTDADFSKTRLIHETVLRTVVYSTWNTDWFQANKSTTWWHSEFDLWIFSDPTFERELQGWRRGLDYLAKMLPDYIVYRKGVPDGLKQFTQRYRIGKVDNSSHILL